MNFSQLALAFLDHYSSSWSSSSSSSSSFPLLLKRLHPITPKLSSSTSIIKTFSTSRLGGMRWNPTPEQKRRLEALYKSGTRTPDAQQIEKITAELADHGRIEGKNVFYWFQNHKARERQKQKRKGSALLAISAGAGGSPEKKEIAGSHGSCKRRCPSWRGDTEVEDDGSDSRTLELFPLHPQNNS